jgi:zinc protease
VRKLAIFNFLLLFCLALPLQAQETNFNQPVPIDPGVRIGKLANGLTYYIRKNDKPENKVELRLAINAGSILERDDQRGLAHFVEHMAFNGTKNFEKNELVSYLQSIGVRFGADLNAYTGFDETVYILPVPTKNKELLDKGLLVLHDWASGITFDENEINKERGVVLEELRLGQGAGQRMRDKFFPKLFEGSQYAVRMPIGERKILETFDRKTIVDFYETWYRPDLMAIVAVGDLDPIEMEAKIKQQFSGLKAKRKAIKRPEFPIADTRGTLVQIVTDKETPGTNVQLFYKKPAVRIKTQADLRQRSIKGFYGALLNQRLIEIRQSPSSPFVLANVNFTPLFRGKDAYVVNAVTDSQSVKATIAVLLDENRRVQQFGFTQPELDRLKAGHLANLEFRYKERNKNESFLYAGEYVGSFLNKVPPTSDEFDYEFGKQFATTVTLTEINQAAKNTTTDDNRAVIITGPANENAKYPTEAEILKTFDEAATAKLTPYTEKLTNEPLIKDLPMRATVTDEKKDDKFGITYWTLSNGVKVVLKPTDFKADQINMYSFSPGGMSLIDTGKARSGLYFQAVVGQSGVKNLSQIELNKMLEGKRAHVAIGVDELFEEVSGGSTPKDFETMLQIAYLKFTNLNFDKTVFDSIMVKQRKTLPTLTGNPQYYFYEQVSKAMAQNHPRFFNIFDLTNFDRVKFEDIQAIYKDRFADASDFTFVFVGNFEPEKIKPLIAKYLGGLPNQNRKETYKDWKIVPPAGPLEKTFKKGVDDKSVVQITYTGEAAYSPDETRNISLLGDLLSIKLVEDLRERKSQVYGVGAQGRMEKIPTGRYTFQVGFSCAPRNVDGLIKEVTAVIAKIRSGAIDDKDIGKIKQTRLLRLEESYKENSFWMSAISSNLKQGDEIYTLEQAKARINAITKADLQQAAQKYLKSENRLQFVLMPETTAANAGQTPQQ